MNPFPRSTRTIVREQAKARVRLKHLRRGEVVWVIVLEGQGTTDTHIFTTELKARRFWNLAKKQGFDGRWGKYIYPLTLE